MVRRSTALAVVVALTGGTAASTLHEHAIDQHVVAAVQQRTRAHEAWGSRLAAEAKHVQYVRAVQALEAANADADTARDEVQAQVDTVPGLLEAHAGATDRAKAALLTARDIAQRAVHALAAAQGRSGVDGTRMTPGSDGIGVYSSDDIIEMTKTVRDAGAKIGPLGHVLEADARMSGAISSGEERLAETEGRVDDNTPRQALREVLDAHIAARDVLGTGEGYDALSAKAAAAEHDIQARLDAVNAAVQARDERLAREEAARKAAAEKAAREQAARDAAARAAANKKPSSSGSLPSKSSSGSTSSGSSSSSKSSSGSKSAPAPKPAPAPQPAPAPAPVPRQPSTGGDSFDPNARGPARDRPAEST